MTEEWKPINGAPGYECSNRGRFRSTDRTLRDGRKAAGCILTPTVSNRGRPKVNVRVDGKPVTLNAPRIVLYTHKGPPPPGKPFTRHHPDDDPWNMDIGNLSWCDRPTNEADKIRRAKRLGYVEPRYAPSQRPVVDAPSPKSHPKIRHAWWSRFVTKIKRWWG